MLVIALFGATLGSPAAGAPATPCRGVDRGLPADFVASVSPEIAKQLGVPSVRVQQSFHYGRWRVLYVRPLAYEDVFLFYSDVPTAQHFITEWSGAAAKFEGASIRKWVVQNAPGIPAKLAGCFAWRVTVDRDM
jgi:hypothetical protein